MYKVSGKTIWHDDVLKRAFNAGLKRAAEIVADFETGGDDGDGLASKIEQEIRNEIGDTDEQKG